MPLCARCTGIYIGAFLAFFFFFLRKRMDGNKTFSIKQIIWTILCITPLAADGFGSYIGLWESNQLARVLTGSLAGAVIPALFLLAGNFDPVGKNEKEIYKNTAEVLFLPVLSAGFGICLWLGFPLQRVGAMVSVLGEICFWAGVPYLILKNIFGKKKIPFRGISLAVSFAVLFIMGGLIS